MQIIDIYLTAYGGATVWFADNQALQGSLIHTLKVGHHYNLKMFTKHIYFHPEIFNTGGPTDKIFWGASGLGEDTREDDGGFNFMKKKNHEKLFQPISRWVGRTQE